MTDMILGPSIKEGKALREPYPGDYDVLQDPNMARAIESPKWLFNQSKSREWVNKNRSSFLWISATSGAGKTALSQSIIRALENRAAGQEAIFFLIVKEDNHN